MKASLHGCGYTSARLKTKKRDGTTLFSKLYGRIEFRAKVPWGQRPVAGAVDAAGG